MSDARQYKHCPHCDHLVQTPRWDERVVCSECGASLRFAHLRGAPHDPPWKRLAFLTWGLAPDIVRLVFFIALIVGLLILVWRLGLSESPRY